MISKPFDIFQLGHVSKSLNVIQNKFPFVKYNKSFICDICHIVKQNILLFPLSASKFKKILDLISSS